MALHRFARIVVVATFFLLIAGGLVTSTDSGLSVPDWPLSYGSLFPPMVGGIIYEHSHRLIAATVGLFTLILTGWLLISEKRRWVRWLGLASLAAVVLQGILGGLTVLYQLPVPISVAHACLGQTFFCLVVALAFYLEPASKQVQISTGYPQEEKAGVRENKSFLILSAVMFGVVYLQLIFGAILRHTQTGLGLHVGGALAVIFCVSRLLLQALDTPRDRLLLRRILWLVILIGIQVGLGLLSISKLKSVPLVTGHVVTGALILATTLVICLDSGTCSKSAGFVEPGTFGTGTAFHWSDYLKLTKPRLTLLVVATTWTGFLIASRGRVDTLRLVWTLLGTGLLVGGAKALNDVLERSSDAKMLRTARRPLPAGRLHPLHATFFGLGMVILGLSLLWIKSNPLTCGVGLAAAISYLLFYTPLKTKSSLCTLVGAIPGALPPMMGWAAARNEISPGAWLLFGILFLWQLPHFLALAWTYREDYARANLPMLSVVDEAGGALARQIALYSLALLPVSLWPAVWNLTGRVYFFGALALGMGLLGLGLAAAWTRSRASARALFLGSVIYLPLLLVLMIIDKI